MSGAPAANAFRIQRPDHFQLLIFATAEKTRHAGVRRMLIDPFQLGDERPLRVRRCPLGQHDIYELMDSRRRGAGRVGFRDDQIGNAFDHCQLIGSQKTGVPIQFRSPRVRFPASRAQRR